MSIIIKGGTIVSSNKSYISDIKIEGEKITCIAENIQDDSAEIINATGKLLFPGFIDSHTHLELDNGYMKTADNFETGTAAAIVGGTTTILDFATQNKGETLNEALDNWHKLAENISSCDYGFHMAITEWNESVKSEIVDMRNRGINSFKAYMAYDSLRINDGEIYELLKCLKENGAILGVHCENGDMVNTMIKEQISEGHMTPKAHPKSRPNLVEAEAVSRFVDIAYLAKAPIYIVHLSTKESLEVVYNARKRGQIVYIETCPQYLLLDESMYEKDNFENAKFVLSPPLRGKEDIDSLWKAIENKTVDIIGTDHCSFNFKEQKEFGIDNFSKIPNGIPGVEHRPSLIYTYGVNSGKMTKEEMCNLLSEKIAKLFGMYPNKGAIQVGSDADIVIWDTEKKSVISAKTQTQNVDYTPFEGFEIVGGAEDVFLRGNHIVHNGKIINEKFGKYVKRGDIDV